VRGRVAEVVVPKACDAVLHIAAALRPRSVLAVGAAAEDCLRTGLGAGPPAEWECLAGAQLSARLARLGRFDLAYVAGVLEDLPRAEAARLLARLRDVHARHLVVLVPDAVGEWDEAALRAYGLRPSAHQPEGGDGRLYEFDLYDYKETPDWLNARYWAHPELWDKYRW